MDSIRFLKKRDDNLNFKIKFNSFRGGMNVFTTSTYIFVHLKTYQDEEGVQKKAYLILRVIHIIIMMN